VKACTQMTKAELIQRIADLKKRQSAGGMAFAQERMAHDLEVHQVELETQNQELQGAQHLLEDSRDRYADLYDFAPVGLLTLDSRGTIREINLTACAMLGAERTRLLHQPFHTHVAPDDRAKLRPHLELRGQPGARVETELQLVGKGRATIVLNVQSVLMGDEENGDLRCRAALTDVTAHRRAEVALHHATERFEVAVAGSADGLWDWDLTTDSVYYSPRFKELLGFTATDRRFPDVLASFKTRLHPEDVGPTQDAIARAVRDGAPYRATYRLKTADGDWRWFEARGATLRDAHDAATRMAGSITDITERRQTEESLRASEQRFRHLVESTRMIGWERPVKATSFTYVSPWAREALGYPLSDWMKPGFFHKQMVHPDDRKALAQRNKEALAREDDFELEYRLVTADGRTLWFRDIVHVVRGIEGPEVLKGFLIDITARKHAETALRESELQQRLALEGADLGLWDWNVPTGHFAVNERWSTMLGHAAAEIEPQIESWRERVHPDDYPTARGAWEAHRAGQADSYEAEYRIRHKQRSWVWILDKGRVIERAADGAPIRVCGTHLDITERKMAEAALRLSEERFRQMSGAINQVFWMTSVDKNEMLYVSPAYERIWGRTCASLYAAPGTWLDAVHPEDRATLLAAITAQQAAGTYDVDYRILRPDGAERWIRDRAFPIGDGTGALQGITGIAEDITERRRMQIELLKISDDVQQRIGQDLHDDICQKLAGITFRLQRLQGKGEANSAIHRGIGEITDLLRGATVDARTLAHTLAPVSVEPGGLTDALEGLAARSASLFGIPVDFTGTQPVTVSDAVAAGHLYRIAQEAITNARTHGKARRIRVTLAATPAGACLTIADNGRGCPLPIADQGGMGLRIMHSRAGLIGATLRLAPTKGGGLTISCDFRSHTPPP
jgi:PAS domain S-box-containing protein